MKKFLISALSTALILGVGTAVLAEGFDTDLEKDFNQMKLYMEKMHPNFSNQELKEMYDSCHGKNGMMKNVNHMETMNHQQMMNNF